MMTPNLDVFENKILRNSLKDQLRFSLKNI